VAVFIKPHAELRMRDRGISEADVAIYEIDRGKNQVVVLFVGHREKVYDDFSKMF